MTRLLTQILYCRNAGQTTPSREAEDPVRAAVAANSQETVANVAAGGSPATRYYWITPFSKFAERHAKGWQFDGVLPPPHGHYSIWMTRPDSAPPRRAGRLPAEIARGFHFVRLARWLRAAGRFFGGQG